MIKDNKLIIYLNMGFLVSVHNPHSETNFITENINFLPDISRMFTSLKHIVKQHKHDK